jgi:hypothetical protein
MEASVGVAEFLAKVVDELSVAGIQADGGDERGGEITKRRNRSAPLDHAGGSERGAIHSIQQGCECKMHGLF